MTTRDPTSGSRCSAVKTLAAIPLAAASSAHAQLTASQKVLRYAFEVAETGFHPVQLSDR